MPAPRSGTVGLASVCITSTNKASSASNCISFLNPSNSGCAGSRPMKIRKVTATEDVSRVLLGATQHLLNVAVWEVPALIICRRSDILTEISCRLPQSLPTNSGIITYNRPRSLSSIPFSLRYLQSCSYLTLYKPSS
jgi:hypothetical protein